MLFFWMFLQILPDSKVETIIAEPAASLFCNGTKFWDWQALRKVETQIRFSSSEST